MALQIDSQGMVLHIKVHQARSLIIERGPLRSVAGIVVHQTGAATAAATFNSYRRPGANGAHFLIDVGGVIHQTASVHKKTFHVGKLKSRCLAALRCSPASYPGMSPDDIHRVEIKKAAPARYPSNEDALGIELVGAARLPQGFQVPRAHARWTPDQILGQYGVYDRPTAAQNQALAWLVDELIDTLKIAPREVLRHPVVSWKNPTEAAGATW